MISNINNYKIIIMLDYEGLAALAAVIELQSFQRAAEALFVTQSAISQRIKSIEHYYGAPVLIRTQPYQATNLGSTLLGHYRRTMLLEDALKEELSFQITHQPLSIAISRDSLETWFMPVINRLNILQSTLLKIIADDQEVTLNYLKNGLVSACASTTAQSLAGSHVEFLGYFDYVLVASPGFKKKYLRQGDIKTNLVKATAIIFDHKDTLHAQYLKHFFNIIDSEINYHIIPSVAGFKQFALNGYAYALIPVIDIQHELETGQLINLFPKKIWEMPIYWHTFAIKTKMYQLFNELIYSIARHMLRQK